MTQPKKPGKAAAKAAAARAENAPTPEAKACEWRGITLTLPARLPATIAFDVADLEANEDNALGPMFRLLEGLFGKDQLQQVRGKLDTDGTSLQELPDTLVELVGLAFEPYGVSLGESEASPAS